MPDQPECLAAILVRTICAVGSLWAAREGTAMDRDQQRNMKGASSLSSETASVWGVGARLDSWKQIAAHMGWHEKTLRRWERRFALPVRRYPGRKGRVYAFQHELKEWQQRSETSGKALPVSLD